MAKTTLDLNDPDDCREYIKAWIDRGVLKLGRRGQPVHLDDFTDEDYLRVARQLFTQIDQRAAPGGEQ